MYRLCAFFLILFCAAKQARAQITGGDPSAFVPRYSVALGYTHVRANAPPASCGCFNMNAGFASASVPVLYWLNAAVEVTGGHASRIGPLGQDLTLTTFTAGPQVTLRNGRFLPFAQVLFGVGHGGDSYFPRGATYSTSATSFAFNMGGGIDFHRDHRLALRLLEAQYLRTQFPNGAGNAQNQVLLGAGVVFKLDGAYALPSAGHGGYR